jgi:hypothetical protein
MLRIAPKAGDGARKLSECWCNQMPRCHSVAQIEQQCWSARVRRARRQCIEKSKRCVR